MARNKKVPKISVINWMGTLLLCAIPGVNIIAIICFLIFAKSPSKKTFAGALLIWTILIAVASALLLFFFPEEAADLANILRDTAAQMPTPTPAPIVP